QALAGMLLDEAGAEARHHDVLRRGELLADTADRARGRGRGIGRIHLDHEDGAAIVGLRREEIGDRAAHDAAADDDRVIAPSAHAGRRSGMMEPRLRTIVESDEEIPASRRKRRSKPIWRRPTIGVYDGLSRELRTKRKQRQVMSRAFVKEDDGAELGD